MDFSNSLPYIAIGLSALAFAFSLLNFFLQRAKDRRDLFLSIHQSLISPEIQEGRRRLHSYDESDLDKLKEYDLESYQQINRALAMFDVFAMYSERKYIKEEVALSEWGHSVALIWPKAKRFMHARKAGADVLPWPHLRRFGPKAVAWAANAKH